MWIFLNDSFISLVAAEGRDDALVVRARFRGDIEALWDDVEVIEGAGSDYEFRALVETDAVVRVIGERLASVGYGNFKGSVRDHARHDVYARVWTVMLRAQEERLGSERGCR